MTSEWINHVKQYAQEHNLSYKEALSQASQTYHKQGGSVKSDFIRNIIYTDKFNPKKMKRNNKSKFIMKKEKRQDFNEYRKNMVKDDIEKDLPRHRNDINQYINMLNNKNYGEYQTRNKIIEWYKSSLTEYLRILLSVYNNRKHYEFKDSDIKPLNKLKTNIKLKFKDVFAESRINEPNVIKIKNMFSDYLN